jgi:hypothetical protein
MTLNLFPEDAYRVWLFPIIGEEANAIIDDEGLDGDTGTTLFMVATA